MMDRLEAEEAMEGELTEESTEKHLGQQPKKFYAEWCRFILDLLLFYTTAFFVLLAVFSLFALVFLVPFFIDPAWSTLQADFDPMGTQCRTISGDYLEGKRYIHIVKKFHKMSHLNFSILALPIIFFFEIDLSGDTI